MENLIEAVVLKLGKGQREPYPDQLLPKTGIDPEWEKSLSAPFVLMNGYGTRCSTALTVSQEGRVHFTEQSFNNRGESTAIVDLQFTME